MAALAPCLAARPVTHSHPARRIVAAAAASNEAAAPAFTRRNAVAATLAAGEDTGAGGDGDFETPHEGGCPL